MWYSVIRWGRVPLYALPSEATGLATAV